MGMRLHMGFGGQVSSWSFWCEVKGELFFENPSSASLKVPGSLHFYNQGCGKLLAEAPIFHRRVVDSRISSCHAPTRARKTRKERLKAMAWPSALFFTAR